MSSLITRLTREVFRHHSNPWSAWTRLLSVPLVFVPIWTRSWRQGAIVGVWLMVNPIAFPEPKNDKAWATRAVLGEEMWIAKRPLDRAMALNGGATALGLYGSGELTSDGGVHSRADGAVAGVLARDGSLLRTPPRRTCVTLSTPTRAIFGELRTGEVRRNYLLGTWVNKPAREAPDFLVWHASRR